VLVRSAPGPHEAATLAERLRNAVLPPVEVDAVRLSLDVSIGLAWFPDHGADVEALVQRADVAMYQAKGAGGGVHAYAADRDAHSLERLAMAQDLRGAVDRGEVRVHFQPQVDLRTGRVAGVEALARWTHPLLGVVPPADFIPVAEETGVIGPLTDHVLDESIARTGAWRRQGIDLHVAVNLSARTLADEALPARIAALCAEHGLPPEALVLEITESMVFHDPVAAAATLERIADLGCMISIDDFGTGFSSLENLKRLPVGEVKVDRSFIAGLDGDERDRAIVRGTLELAHALGMRVVAEGVEHDGMLDELQGMGCEIGQGWLWSRPVPAEDLPAAVARIASSAPQLRRVA
jgi:diguanylate cyclase